MCLFVFGFRRGGFQLCLGGFRPFSHALYTNSAHDIHRTDGDFGNMALRGHKVCAHACCMIWQLMALCTPVLTM